MTNVITFLPQICLRPSGFAWRLFCAIFGLFDFHSGSGYRKQNHTLEIVGSSSILVVLLDIFFFLSLSGGRGFSFIAFGGMMKEKRRI